VQCFTSPPTQYRLYGRRFLQVKRPNQQYHRHTPTTSAISKNGCIQVQSVYNTANDTSTMPETSFVQLSDLILIYKIYSNIKNRTYFVNSVKTAYSHSSHNQKMPEYKIIILPISKVTRSCMLRCLKI